MFNIFGQDKEKESLEARNQQDNFYSQSAYNGNYQYCRFCNEDARFEYDRCCKCKNN